MPAQNPRTDPQRQLNLAEAVEARDEALVRVEENAPADWLDEAYRVVGELAARCEAFTTDDVWNELGSLVPHEPRALGPVMLRAARERIIVKSGRMTLSARRSRHAAPITVWRSLIYKPEDSA